MKEFSKVQGKAGSNESNGNTPWLEEYAWNQVRLPDGKYLWSVTGLIQTELGYFMGYYSHCQYSICFRVQKHVKLRSFSGPSWGISGDHIHVFSGFSFFAIVTGITCTITVII